MIPSSRFPGQRLFLTLLLGLLIAPAWGADVKRAAKPPDGNKPKGVVITAPHGAQRLGGVSQQTIEAYRQASRSAQAAKKTLDTTFQRMATLDGQLKAASGDDRAQLLRQRNALESQAAIQQVQLIEAGRNFNQIRGRVERAFAGVAAGPPGITGPAKPSSSASTSSTSSTASTASTASTGGGQQPPATIARAARTNAARGTTGEPGRVLQRTVRQQAGLVATSGTPMPVAAPQSRVAASSGFANTRRVQVTQRGPATQLTALKPTPGGRVLAIRRSPSQIQRERVQALDRLRANATGIRPLSADKPWSGQPGSVALNHQYDLEFVTPSHLYGRIAGDFQKAWERLPGDTRPTFDTWLTSAAAGGANVPGQQEFDAVRARHGGAYPTPVTYLSRDQSTGHELVVSGGQVGIRSGAQLNRTTEQGMPQPVVFVVSEGGRVLAGNYERGKFHHSSLVAGGNVQGAGELYFAPDGRLQAISDKSGHYMPDRIRLLQGLSALKKASVPLENVSLLINGKPEGISAGLFVRSEGWRLDAANFGTLTRADTENRLRGQPEGTWLLRQSDNLNYGGVISRVTGSGIEHTALALRMDEFRAVAASNPQATLFDLVKNREKLQDNRMLKPVPDLPQAVGF
ncbi:MAG: SH2 domain-containing protein [Pseudomonadales bacterium]